MNLARSKPVILSVLARNLDQPNGARIPRFLASTLGMTGHMDVVFLLVAFAIKIRA
jgi:hypothetical protein